MSPLLVRQKTTYSCASYHSGFFINCFWALALQNGETALTLRDMASSFLQRWEPIFLSLLRIVVGLLLLEHGTQKLFHFPPPDHPMPSPLPPFLLVGGWIEFVGGLLLIFGLLSRLVAFIIAGEMAVAYFMVHAPGSLYPIKNHGELAVALCFVFLYVVVAGGGSWSLDSIWRRGQSKSAD